MAICRVLRLSGHTENSSTLENKAVRDQTRKYKRTLASDCRTVAIYESRGAT
jgi:hypothetical protein